MEDSRQRDADALVDWQQRMDRQNSPQAALASMAEMRRQMWNFTPPYLTTPATPPPGYAAGGDPIAVDYDEVPRVRSALGMYYYQDTPADGGHALTLQEGLEAAAEGFVGSLAMFGEAIGSNYPDFIIGWFGEEPGYYAGQAPVVGPFRKTVYNFEKGNIWYGLGNLVLTVSDASLAGIIVRGMLSRTARAAWMFKGPFRWERWGGVSQRLSAIGYRAFGQPIHHWAAGRSSGLFRWIPSWLKNQPWNYVKVKEPYRLMHNLIEGKGPIAAQMSRIELWYNQIKHGTPSWFKPFFVSTMGRPIDEVTRDENP